MEHMILLQRQQIIVSMAAIIKTMPEKVIMQMMEKHLLKIITHILALRTLGRLMMLIQLTVWL